MTIFLFIAKKKDAQKDRERSMMKKQQKQKRKTKCQKISNTLTLGKSLYTCIYTYVYRMLISYLVSISCPSTPLPLSSTSRLISIYSPSVLFQLNYDKFVKNIKKTNEHESKMNKKKRISSVAKGERAQALARLGRGGLSVSYQLKVRIKRTENEK